MPIAEDKIREALKQDLEGTVRAVAQMGYQCVEFYGPYFEWSESQTKQIRKLLEKEGVSPEVGGLRVGVQGGGCSGLSYAMRLDTQARDRDKIFEEFGARIFVDPKSFLYLNGTTLEYEETLMRQGFVFQNPNAARNCGCGSSFTA